jgi:DNA-binding transcriptional regulator YiaG
MPNLASVLKEEIQRLARKEAKAHAGPLQKAVARYRRDIASLKRQLDDAKKRITYLEAKARDQIAAPADGASVPESARFSTTSVKSQRRRLGFSAKDYGRLIGVSGLTVYNWEQGKSRPRQTQLASLVAVRGIGKREALKRLELLNGKA